MECEGCGITTGDLPLEKEEAEEFFVYDEGDHYCVGCASIRGEYIDFSDGNGYDYEGDNE